jgi:hypothetical protein
MSAREDDPSGISSGAAMEDPNPTDQEAWQRFKANFIQRKTERYRRLYTRTRNPVHALNAYRLNRHTKNEVPAWILELFDQWAEVLCVQQLKGGKEISHALGFGSKGGPSITSKAEKETRDLWIAECVLALRDIYPERDKLDIFLQVAEKFELSSERVAGIWSKLTRGVKY